MPRAIALPIRQAIVERLLQGQSLASVATDLHLSCRTVRNIWRRYRIRGVAGLGPDYHRCARPRASAPRRVIRAACWLRRHHPTWGAGLIRELLHRRWPDRALPGTRALQRRFREAGLNRPGGRPRRADRTCGVGSAPYDDRANAAEEEGRRWMLGVLQCKIPVGELRPLLADQGDVDILYDAIKDGKLRERNKALAVLAHLRGISMGSIARFLHVYPRTVSSYCSVHRSYGCRRLFDGFYRRDRKSDDELLRNTLFATLHTPPKAFGINRTTWRMPDLRRVLAEKGQKVGAQVIRAIIKAAGYTWRNARTALTSNDPEYREKLAKIQAILSKLGPNERFFSIDEYGPFAVKMQGGRSLMPPGEVRIVPQRQKSKGCLILTGALELSTNQVTHFYSEKKNTAEMIKLLEVLLVQYADCERIYLSWDAASWHASKLLYRRVEEINSPEYRAVHKVPHVELAPLPSCAQFLNVIESVFSGMARAIIHNSDYESVGECKAAIDRHFAERNAFFLANPKRAGRVIWGKEDAPSEFSPSSNCKSRNYYYFGI